MTRVLSSTWTSAASPASRWTGRLSWTALFSEIRTGAQDWPYFLEHISASSVLTNRANGKTVTTTSRVINHDLRVTDNGDGTLSILFQATGNDVIYGADGKAIGRNPGQIRLEFLIDHSGTPSDPSDDVFLAEEIVRGSTGRSDDFCGTVVPALS